MASLRLPIRQLVLAGGFAIAIAAAPVAAVSMAAPGVSPAPSVASCQNGQDLRAGVCEAVEPGGPVANIPGNPNLPAVNLPGGGSIPCTGANTGECIGLTESGAGQEPVVKPKSTFGDTPVSP